MFPDEDFRVDWRQSQNLSTSREPHGGQGSLGFRTLVRPTRVTCFRFRCLAQIRHGLHGGESPRRRVSATAAGPLLATGQVLGPFAHLQRAREPAAHRVAAGEELLREVEAAGAAGAAEPAAGCGSAVGRARGPVRPPPQPEPARGFSRRGKSAPRRSAPRWSPSLSFLPRSPARSVDLLAARSGLRPLPAVLSLSRERERGPPPLFLGARREA